MSSKTRKLIWSVPLVAVFAVVGAFALFVALAPNDAAAQNAQTDYQAGSPMELMVEPGSGAAKRTSLVLTWKAPTTGSDLAITGYRIDQSKEDGQRWTKLADVGSSVLTHTHTGLKPNTQMYYRVLAMNQAGVGRVSEAKSSMTAAIGEPSEVQNFTVTATGPSSIKLDWDPPSDTGGARIIGYLVHWGDTDTIGGATGNIKLRGTADMDGSADGIVPVLAPKTEWTHKGLDGNSTRHYKVYAVNWYDDDMTSKMTKDPIDVRSATTMPPGKPAAPTSLTAVPAVVRDSSTPFAIVADDDDDTNGYEPAPNVNLYWYWPTDEGGADISRFRIEVSKTGAWPDGSTATAGTATEASTTLETDDFAVMVVLPDAAFGTTGSHQFVHTGAGQFLKSPGTLYYRVFAENGTVTQVERRSLPDMESAQARVTKAMTMAPRPAPVAPSSVAWVNSVQVKASSRHHHDSVNLSWMAPRGGRNPDRLPGRCCGGRCRCNSTQVDEAGA